MIKITYKCDSYNYEGVGKQPYTIDTVIDVDQDASMADAMQAFITALKIAEYRVNRERVLQAVENAFDELEA